jgi:hypothetical protein
MVVEIRVALYYCVRLHITRWITPAKQSAPISAPAGPGLFLMSKNGELISSSLEEWVRLRRLQLVASGITVDLKAL